MCPDQGSNQRPFAVWDDTPPTEPRWSGSIMNFCPNICLFFKCCIEVCLTLTAEVLGTPPTCGRRMSPAWPPSPRAALEFGPQPWSWSKGRVFPGAAVSCSRLAVGPFGRPHVPLRPLLLPCELPVGVVQSSLSSLVPFSPTCWLWAYPAHAPFSRCGLAPPRATATP